MKLIEPFDQVIEQRKLHAVTAHKARTSVSNVVHGHIINDMVVVLRNRLTDEL